MDQKLPLGIQDFEKLRKVGFAYVDKTARVYRRAQHGVPVLLVRPHRFGKSLFVSTLKAYFEGRRDLFEGLEIERLVGNGAGAWQKRPVFLLDFSGADYTHEGSLSARLKTMPRRFEAEWNIRASELVMGNRFRSAIEAAHHTSGQRVVVLADDYDKPLTDTMDNTPLFACNRSRLTGFLSALKRADEHLAFVFVTGTTKLPWTSVSGGLNQLRDISWERDFADVCGITEDELLATFAPKIEARASRLDLSSGGCLKALRDSYDGYCFHPDGPMGPDGPLESRKVYDPRSLLNALENRRLGSRHIESNIPAFLARRLRDARLDAKRLTDGTIFASETRLSCYAPDDPDPIPLFFQTGCLTIRAADTLVGEYALGVPNDEVKRGLLECLLSARASGHAGPDKADAHQPHRFFGK